MSLIAQAAAPGRLARSRFTFDRLEVLGPLFIMPAILYVVVLVGLPFLLALYYSVSAYSIFNPSYTFVGLKNFREVIDSEIFRRTLANTLIFTISSQIIGLLLGKIGAMLLMQEFPGRRLARALIVLPWAVPVSLATLAWGWMFDSLYSVINWTLVAAGMIDAANRPQWLGQEDLAMISGAGWPVPRLFSFGSLPFLFGFSVVRPVGVAP